MAAPFLIRKVILSWNYRTRNPHTWYKLFVWILTFIAYTSYHLSRKPISVVKGVLYCNVSLNSCHAWAPFNKDNGDTLLGALDSCFLFAYAAGMFFSGHIAERVNLRYFLSAGMLGVGLFTTLFGMGMYWNIHSMVYYVFIQGIRLSMLYTVFWVWGFRTYRTKAVNFQIFAGLFQSTGWPSVVTCVANWFGKGRRGIVMGIWNAHTSVGNILGGFIPGAFANVSHWGLAFIVPGAIIGGLGIVMFMILVPYPEEVGLESPNKRKGLAINSADGIQECDSVGTDDNKGLLDPSDDESGIAEDNKQQAISLWKALKIPGVIEFSLCLFFSKLVSYTFLFWLPFYISKTSTYSNTQSADLATIFDVGGIVGGIMAGGMADVTRRPGTICVVMLIMAAPALHIYNQYGHSGFVLSIELLLLTGMLVNGPYALITTAVSADLGTHDCLRGNAKALSTVTAIIDGTGSIGAAVGPLITGILTERHGWQSVFYMLIASDVLAMLMLTRVVFKEMRSCCKKPPESVQVSES